MEYVALKTAYQKLLALPEEKQAEAAELIEAFVANNRGGPDSDCQLSDKQIEEVRRRLTDPNPEYVSHAAVIERFRNRHDL